MSLKEKIKKDNTGKHDVSQREHINAGCELVYSVTARLFKDHNQCLSDIRVYGDSYFYSGHFQMDTGCFGIAFKEAFSGLF